MRVLHIIPSISSKRGGPSFVVRALVQGLARKGITVDVASTDDDGDRTAHNQLDGEAVDDGVTYRLFRRQTRRYTISMPLLVWLWRNVQRYDVVHIHALFSFPSDAGAVVSHLRGTPYILRPLGILNRWGMNNRRPVLKKVGYWCLIRGILERSAAVHFTSDQEYREVQELGPRIRPLIVANPVELPATPLSFRGSFRVLFPKMVGRPLVLFLSRLDEKKGLDLLLPAFQRTLRHCPDAALVIAGNGTKEFEHHIYRMVRENSLEESVCITGFLDGPAKWAAFADSDVFVLPSYSENFGVAAVEAMGMGLPVIVSDCVGIHDDISRAHAGAVVPCTVDDLAGSITRLLADERLRAAMGSNGKRLAREKYSLDSVTATLLETYRTVTQERRRPGVR